MGILTDLFVAAPEDAMGYESLQPHGKIPRGKFEQVQLKGLLDINFTILWALLEGEAWDVNAHVLEELAMGAEGSPWLFRFPDPLVAKLAGLSDSGIARAAELWAETEELRCEPEDIEPVVADLVRLARLALSEEKGLFLWGSL